MEKCIYEGCDNMNRGGGRGLCVKHYMRFTYRVKNGLDTWEKLEEKGLVRRRLTQAEKNIMQMHPHRSYTRKELI